MRDPNLREMGILMLTVSIGVCVAGLVVLGSALAEAQIPVPVLSALQARQYQSVCARCHARPDSGAPLVGDTAAWSERTAPGFETLLRRSIDGWRGMPPLGTCGSCDEADFRALVAYVSGLADPGAGP